MVFVTTTAWYPLLTLWILFWVASIPHM
jgi:hypothetical protein